MKNKSEKNAKTILGIKLLVMNLENWEKIFGNMNLVVIFMLLSFVETQTQINILNYLFFIKRIKGDKDMEFNLSIQNVNLPCTTKAMLLIQNIWAIF